MALDDLDLDISNDYPEREDFTRSGWSFYATAEELEKHIKKNPLLREDIFHFIENCVERIYFLKSCRSEFCGEITPLQGKMLIYLNPNHKEHEITLVHEVVHGVFRAGGWNLLPDQPAREAIIEQEAQRFYWHNQEFVNKLYAQLLTKFDR